MGNSVFVANNDVIGLCAKIEKNTDYTWDFVDGDRYRLALSANYPVNNGTCYIEYVNDTGVKTHTFNSGNYEYAYLYCYNNNDKTYEEIKPLCTLASDTDRTFAPYAMTNKLLTDEVQLLTSETSLTPTGDLAGASADCDIRKVGSLVVGSLFVPGLTLTADTWKDIGTIPVVPKHTTNFCMATVNGDIAVEAQINISGEVRVRSHTGGASMSLRGELVYVAGLAANRSLPEATREAVQDEPAADPEEAPATRSTKKTTKKTASADTNE